ncbi:glycosyltransferase family 32 protein [Pasteurella multocida]|uniref:glycosyltransferase family 32 protein n=1 Tax=Pasteurella multocida TaxID=747 RepID=UPI000F6F9900|nr:glycosyltransferase [Pasteurella multocida]VEJ13839.1 Mannosyltransferase OCH1 and related enzymes [Pasteurella multocida subsp. septica]HEA3246291.1 hypothetical protein [Pasteurella multocida]
MSNIPKIIHYIWVGNKEKPELIINCIQSWKKFLPDYKIIEWNDSALENIQNNYVKEAYRNKKWAFVSDYLRLYALYNYGGIYLDTDCEITQNIDEFLNLDFFSCHEFYGENGIQYPISALMGAKKENSIIKDLFDEYTNLHFETPDGLDLTTNTTRITNYFKRRFSLNEPYDGMNIINLTDNCIIYPYTHFCKKEDGYDNFAIHHFNGSWKPAYERKDKFSISKSLLFSRFEKRKDGEYPLDEKEKIIFKFKVSPKKYYVIIKREFL